MVVKIISIKLNFFEKVEEYFFIKFECVRWIGQFLFVSFDQVLEFFQCERQRQDKLDFIIPVIHFQNVGLAEKTTVQNKQDLL